MENSDIMIVKSRYLPNEREESYSYKYALKSLGECCFTGAQAVNE